MKIAIASGKGGTGKTLIASNLALTLSRQGMDVTYIDCDVEAPNGHLFLKPNVDREEEVYLHFPVAVDTERCILCGKCAQACMYNAVAVLKEKVLFFPELCHVCGACKLVCPTDAVMEEEKRIGRLRHGSAGEIRVHYALLETGVGGMSPRLIKKVKEYCSSGVSILDAPPGTACPAVESVRGADVVALVADPTPFGLNDLKLAVNMCREMGIEPVVLINRAGKNEDVVRYCMREGLEVVGQIPNDRRIAEVYSSGNMVVDVLPEYRGVFEDIGKRLLSIAKEQREVRPPEPVEYKGEISKVAGPVEGKKSKEVVIISGKGGTGKTSIAASFAALSSPVRIADCDVDAADLHLILNPVVRESGLFSGGLNAEIVQDKCVGCGRCAQECRFEAIYKKGERYAVDARDAVFVP